MKMKRKYLAAALMMLALVSCGVGDDGYGPDGRWTPEKAGGWYAATGWRSGCDYIPASAINQIEMWSSSTFDLPTIDKELGWAEELGFTTMRVFLSSVVWNHEPEAFKANIDRFLDVASSHGITPHLVFFDDCWDAESSYGPQRAPKPGIHNSGWVRDPSDALRADTTALYPALEAYVKDIMTTFKDDERVLWWDLYNEPGNSGYKGASLPLVKNVFGWARDVRPSQPVSVGLWSWSKGFEELNEYQLSHSDIISYHCYSSPEDHLARIRELQEYGRPLYCTEYMARKHDSTFQNSLQMLRDNDVSAVNWGFVSGKTNTIFAWDDPLPDLAEPELWFHDIYRQDKTPFSQEEIDVIMHVNGVKQ